VAARGSDPVEGAVTQVEILKVEAVHALARAAAARPKVWWRKLRILLVAY
jgi:hypothetical protein